MTKRDFLRDNLFLVAAAVLPLVVVVFFLTATAVPRWLVPSPAHDLLFTATRAVHPAPGLQDGTRLEYRVSEGQVVARVRRTRDGEYHVETTLYWYDADTGAVREVPVELPGDLPEDGTPRTVAIEALAGVRVTTSYRAPDGYVLENDRDGYPGLFGALLGLGHVEHGPVLVRDGRRVAIELDGDWQRHHSIELLGWVIDEQA